ncbi:MAG: tetratricopeptide repeat protein, partial [Gammaproteobacteria bacterium]
EIAAFLIDRLLIDGKAEEAIDVAWDQEQKHPNNLFVMEKQIVATLAASKPDTARSILKRMADAAKFDTDWLVNIAQYQSRAGYAEDSAYTLSKVLQASPNHVPALLNLALLEINLGRLDSAYARSEALIALNPNDALGYQVRGDVHLRRGETGQAVEDYRIAVMRAPESESAVLALHLAQLQSADLAGAEQTLETWLAKHPESTPAELARAEYYLRTQNYEKARTAYAALTKRQPNNPSLLNNYAGVLDKLKDPTALQVARDAHAQRPTDPLINDTLGWILVRAGQAEEGLRYLREAQARASTQREIQFHLAAALEILGRRDEARRELEEALATNQPFDGRDEAVALLAKIRG